MGSPPAGISEADWLAWPAGAKVFILDQQEELRAHKEEINQLRDQLTTLATELASLRERISRSSRNSSKPPSSDGAGFKPPERRKGRGHKRSGQPDHPGSGPELLPIERADEVVEHHPVACRRCGALLWPCQWECPGRALERSPDCAGCLRREEAAGPAGPSTLAQAQQFRGARRERGGT